jgi:hypothetical protein
MTRVGTRFQIILWRKDRTREGQGWNINSPLIHLLRKVPCPSLLWREPPHPAGFKMTKEKSLCISPYEGESFSLLCKEGLRENYS